LSVVSCRLSVVMDPGLTTENRELTTVRQVPSIICGWL
jgi:hypothetical protein